MRWSYLLLLLISAKLCAQCNSTGFVQPGNLVQDNSLGGASFAVNNPGNAGQSDNLYASSSAIISVLSGTTHYLKADHFGFSIPPDAIICGVVAEVERGATNIGLLTHVNDNEVRLLKAGVLSGNNRALPDDWNSTDQAVVYGNNSDLWGTSLSPFDINQPGFGIVFSERISGIIGLLPNARIDQIRLSVYYTVPLPVKLIQFNAEQKGSALLFNWVSVTEDNLSGYELQGSEDGEKFRDIAFIPAKGTAGNADMPQRYTYAHTAINAAEGRERYFHLQLIDRDGNIKTSRVLQLKTGGRPGIFVYPIPATGQFFIQGHTGNLPIQLTDCRGQVIRRIEQPGAEMPLSINIHGLKSGIYFLYVNNEVRKIIITGTP